MQTLDLDILPPGRTHVVSLPSGEMFLTLSLEPDRVISKGLVTGRQYNLRDPRYRVVVQQGRGGAKAESRVLGPGGHARIGAAQVALGDRSRYVRLQIVSDPALPAVYGGMIVLLAGCAAMCSRFFWYQREFAAIVERGVLLIGCRDEFFRKWGIAKCQRWKEELEALALE